MNSETLKTLIEVYAKLIRYDAVELDGETFTEEVRMLGRVIDDICDSAVFPKAWANSGLQRNKDVL